MRKIYFFYALLTSACAAATAQTLNHDYVDLGLPSGTLWATCNIGAENPWDKGDKFAWGETSTKSEYKRANYKYMYSGMNSDNHYTKYQIADGNTDGIWYDGNGIFIGDNKTVLEPGDDAATVQWGAAWHTPTIEQIQELKENCYVEYADNNLVPQIPSGVKGFIVYKVKHPSDKGKFLYKRSSMEKPVTLASYSLSDTHIFLPSNISKEAFYPSSTLTSNRTSYFAALEISNNGVKVCTAFSYSSQWRFMGWSYRPVVSQAKITITQPTNGTISVQESSLNLNDVNYGTTLHFIAKPANGDYEFVSWSGCNADGSLNVSGNATVTCTFKKKACKITVNNPSEMSEIQSSTPQGTISVQESVDLNEVLLGTKLHFIANPSEGYELDSWSGCNADGTLDVTGPATVTCTFRRKICSINCTHTLEHGTISLHETDVDLNAVPYGTTLHFLATAASDDYEFESWTGCNAEGWLRVTENTTVSCTFRWKLCVVDFTSRAEHGTITLQEGGVNPSAVMHGLTLHFSAQPDEGYVFGGWIGCDENGILVVNADTKVDCKFIKTSNCVVTIDQPEYGTISLVESDIDLDNVEPETTLHFIFEPDEGYTLDTWVGCEADGTVTIYGDTEISCLIRRAMNAKFSVSATKQVRFSQGNLQYQASTGTWRFAENQYDYIGNQNNSVSPTYDGWIDLFAWGTSGWNSGAICYQPYNTSILDADYWPGGDAQNSIIGEYAEADWGVHNAILHGGNEAGLWRTLTIDEWKYLLRRKVGKYGVATVNGKRGLILLPDDWTLPKGLTFNPGIISGTSLSNIDKLNSYSAVQWNKMEQAGAVFLPAAGYRKGTTTSGINQNGTYWVVNTGTGTSTSYANFKLSEVNQKTSSGDNYIARSVRLVQDVQYSKITIEQPMNGLISLVESDIDLNQVEYGTVLHFTVGTAEGCVFKAWSGCNADGLLVVKGNTTISCTIESSTPTSIRPNRMVKGSSVRKVLEPDGLYIIKDGVKYNTIGVKCR